MTRNPRKAVDRFETRLNLGPSRALWPLSTTAVLVCGHRVNLGAGVDYRPKTMACVECGAAGESREVGRRALSLV